MKIVGREKIEDFKRKHPTARKALDRWQTIIESTTFLDPTQMKQTFGSVDVVRQYTIFDIKGNDFRLIAIVIYVEGTLIISKILTHPEYDKWRPK